MESINAKSAMAVHAWNQSVNTVNNSSIKRDYNHLEEQVDAIAELDPKTKTELLVKLTNKRKTMLEGAAFMLGHKKIPLDGLDRALKLLNVANGNASLGAVEAALQTQIDVIQEMEPTPELTNANKTLCLYSLQNMIYALSDYQLENGKKNEFMPKLLQEQYQMLLKASPENWDALNESTYDTRYQDPSNPTLADWKFLDRNKIKHNMEVMANPAKKDSLIDDLNKVHEQAGTMKVTEEGTINWARGEVNKASENIKETVLKNTAMCFDIKAVKDDPSLFYNFVRQMARSKDETIDNVALNKLSIAALRYVAEMGAEQQRNTAMQQQQEGGMTI